MKNVTKKFVKNWSDTWLDYLYNPSYPIESLIANIIPNENEFAISHQVNHIDKNIIFHNNLVEKIELLIISNIWDKLAFWCFTIEHNFNKDYKNYYKDLTFINLIINITDDDVDLEVVLINTSFFKNEEKQKLYINRFKCDRIIAILVNEILKKEKEKTNEK